MPMFIITGSMIRHAISSPRSSSSRSSTSRSLNGTTWVWPSRYFGTPSDIGVDAGCSRPPIRSAFGTTENITGSWWPWYEPSIFTMSSRPVAARAMRIALIVASVPELAKRTCSSRKRRHSSSANSTVSSVGAAKCVPAARRAVDRLDDLRVRVPDDHAAEAAVRSRRTRCRRRPTPARPAPRAGRSGYGSPAWNDDADALRQRCQRALVQRLRLRRAIERARSRSPTLGDARCASSVRLDPLGASLRSSHQCLTMTCLISV